MKQENWEKQLGGKIRAYRLKAGFTQQEAADLYDCSLRWWQTIESGRNLSVEILLRMEKVLKVKAWQLLKWQ